MLFTSMFTYRNENAFSKALITSMKNKGIFAQRIESGLTGRGIPDIYAIVGRTPVWIELKRVHKKCQRYEIIPWRPGQQAWLNKVTALGQQAITLCCFDDCIVKIKHDIIYKQDVVDTSYCEMFYSLKEVLK